MKVDNDRKDSFFFGLKDGLPIFLGYISVSFAFGIFAVGSGLSVLQTLVISLVNVTSAGQLAAVPIITGGGSLMELALSQLVINSRYSLMSISLAQKLGSGIRLFDRFVISFMNTDEVFAVASGRAGLVGRRYMYGLIFLPYIGWAAGTLLGAVAGNILPGKITNALGIAIYGMFIAIIAPAARKSFPVLTVVLSAAVLSCLFRFLPGLNNISSGLAVIICACVSGIFGALFFPVEGVRGRESGDASAGERQDQKC